MLTSRPLKAICSSKYMTVDKGVLSKAITGVIFVADICRAKVLPVFSFLVGTEDGVCSTSGVGDVRPGTGSFGSAWACQGCECGWIGGEIIFL